MINFILFLDCQDCGTVPRAEEPSSLQSTVSAKRIVPSEEGARFMTTHDFLSLPKGDSIIALSQQFLDAMCPLEGSRVMGFHAVTTHMPPVMPCQVECPQILESRARKPAQIM